MLFALPLRADDAAKWQTVWHESFEKSTFGAPIGAPWVQRHKQRQITATNKVALDGKQAATYRYEVAPEGSLDQEAGLFFMETRLPREKDDAPVTWRISAALRFSPEAWTATTFTLRGPDAQPALALINSMNMLYLGGEHNVPVWSVAKPDQWYRVQIVLREAEKTFDLSIGEEGDTYRNQFFNVPLASERLPLQVIGFGYAGALVRYGQGRESFLDDVRVERLAR